MKQANKQYPAPRPEWTEHPGVYLLEEILQPLGITQAKFAGHIGVSQMTISDLVRGKRNFSSKLALAVGRALNMSPEFWLNMQRSYDYAQEITRLKKSGQYEKIMKITSLVTA